MKRAFAALMFLALISMCEAWAEAPTGFHGFFGFGANYHPGNSVRVGWKDWELGKLTASMLGVDKRFFFENIYYAELGVGIAGFSGASEPAVIGGIGIDKNMFWLVGIRAELYAIVNSSAVARGEGLVGLSIQF